MTTEQLPSSEQDLPFEGGQQIPVIVVRDEPAAGSARASLLEAIGLEAGQVAELQPGNAAGALADLARAYALVIGTEVTSTTALVARRIDSTTT
ncbi:hypothetical protein [Nocardia sp. NPDC051570]|uniref:hypothetical protein n=1 Tax=Nocardia sp. NPDC051570 TaxID=3364324 RepID=UPI00378F7841